MGHPLPKLAQPAGRALASIGVSWLDELSRFTESEVKNLHGMGPNALKVLREAMVNANLKFAEQADDVRLK